MYKIINIDEWKRKQHFMAFKNSFNPNYDIGLELDITKFKQYLKNNNMSFTIGFIHLVSKCANEIEAFRYRFKDGNVVLYDKIDTSFTYMADGELFKVVNVDYVDDMKEYIKIAKETIEKQKVYFTGPMSNSCFQFSPLPWISFKSISHTYGGNKENATPIFDFGKYYFQDGKILLPFSIMVNHCFVDGIHVARLVERINKELEKY